MQTSTIMFQDLNDEIRIDAEYYRIEVLNRLGLLEREKCDFLKNLANFVVGPFGSTIKIDSYVENSQYKYIRNKDVNYFRIDDTNPALIPQTIYSLLPQFHIKENDLLITVVGTLGKTAIATDKDTKSVFSCKSTIIRSTNINPFYLLTYLNSDTGKLILLRGKRGAIQEGLNLSDLKEIPIFIPSTNFQNFIENTIKKGFVKIEQSKNYYCDAQTFFLSELGLTNWQPKHQLSFIKNYSDTEQAGRIDADYYQPKYEEIIKAIKGYAGGWDKLKNLSALKNKNHKPKYKQAYKYIELSHIASNGEIADCMVAEGQELPSRARRKVAVGDVIVSSIEGSLSSIAMIGDKYNQALCSTGFHVIKSDLLNSETLLVLLKSIVGQLQLKKGCRGTILTAINKDEMGEIILPILSPETQTQIQQKVIESSALREQSKHLLECAKRAVEIAIEQDEKTAIDWLEENTQDLGKLND